MEHSSEQKYTKLRNRFAVARCSAREHDGPKSRANVEEHCIVSHWEHQRERIGPPIEGFSSAVTFAL